MSITTYEQGIELVYNLIENNHKDIFIIAIDGKSASGKTTFANTLSSLCGIQVLHTDDFFKPIMPDKHVKISEFDGNFDISRFYHEAVCGMRSGTEFEVGIFDCKTQNIIENRLYAPSKCFIVEGAYSLSPRLGKYADFKMFFDIDPEFQRNRIINRNGEDSYRRFREIWIPAEERYFLHYDVLNTVDIIIKSEDI